MASKRRERSLEELHNATVLIPCPTKVPSQDGIGLDKSLMQQKGQAKAESGTCNVCSTPCSSCMHREYGHMGSKGNEFSDDNCVATVTRQHTGSEASNVPGVDSSHDSLYENVDSKASVNLSNLVDALVKLENVPEDQPSPRKCVLDEMILSSKHQEVKAEDGPDDNLSCISRANDVYISPVLESKNIDSKCSTAVVSSLGMEGSGKAQASKHTGSGPVDDVKRSNKVEQDEKFNKSVELLKTQELPLQSISGEETDDSEMVEQDVKVCDICGDVGREYLLAICSRCSDGAEHTYCMRKMLHKVPEGDWLCEECKLADVSESQKRGSDADIKRMKNIMTMQRSGKRHAEVLEAGSPSKKRMIQASSGSPRPSSASGIATLSRESSLKSLDNGKAKPVNQTSIGRQTHTNGPDIARASFSGQQGQTRKGSLLKSKSFNTTTSGMKVKLDEIPEKYKGVRENSSLKVECPPRMMGRSMSLKNTGRLTVSDSKVKMLSLKDSPFHNVKGLKRLRDESLFERRKLSRMERPSGDTVTLSSKNDSKITPRGDVTFPSSASDNREVKRAISDGKFLSRSTSNASCKVRASSAYGVKNAFVEHKLVKHSPKVETSFSSWTERRSSNSIVSSQDGLRKSNLGAKDLEQPKLLRPSSTTGPKLLPCQKCKEFGHTAPDCKTAAGASGTVSPVAGTPRDVKSKESKLKAAIEAAMQKKSGIFWKKKERDESDAVPSPKKGVSSEAISQDQISIANKRKTMIFYEGTVDGERNIETCPSDPQKQTKVDAMKQHFVHSADCLYPTNAGDSDPIISVIQRPHHSESRSPLLKISVIPEHDFIWQGAFEVYRSGKFLDLCGEFQAHLSTCASPKVVEVVNKFPQKIAFDELPRLSTWPRQFLEDYANEDNIALYFFAKDHESYERSYKKLLERTINEDLALKGSFDGVELMIFPSSRLPESSQCWNTLYFLWGVFRARKSSSSVSSNNPAIPSLNVVSKSKVIPSEIVPQSETQCSTERINHEISMCEIPPVSGLSASDKPYISLNKDTSEKIAPMIGSKSSPLLEVSVQPSEEVACTSLALEETGMSDHRRDKDSSSLAGTYSSSSALLESEMHKNASTSGGDSVSVGIPNADDQVLGLARNFGRETIVNGRDNSDSVRIKVELDLNEDVTIDVESDQITEVDCFQSSYRKRQQLEDGGSVTKKLTSGFSEPDESNGPSDGNLLPASFSPPVPFENMRAAESYLFVADSRLEKTFQFEGSSTLPRKEDSSSDGVPFLDLALGEVKSPDKKILPFFVGIENRNNDDLMLPYSKVTDKEEEADIAASLSLSLSSPPRTRNEPRHPEFSLRGSHITTRSIL